MVPFDRLLQRINAVGCAGFVLVVLMHVFNWAAGSGGTDGPFTLGNVWGTSRSLIARVSSQNSGQALSIDPVNGGLMVTDWTAHNPENRLTLSPTDAAPPVWTSKEDERLSAAHARYEAWFREYQRHISSSRIAAVKGVNAAFGPATQYAYTSNCGAQMSEVAEFTQHR